jgi:disulfide bond formation protein DsbB
VSSGSGLTHVISLVLAVSAALLQLALVLLALLALCSLFSPRARELLIEARETLLGGELWAAAGVAIAATLGSLYFSEVAHFTPCDLCWLQRVGMYPLVIVLVAAAIRNDVRRGAIFALPLAGAGALIAIFQIYIGINPSAEPSTCRAGTSCTTKWIDELGYVTIPVLSLTAFAAVIALMLLALSRTRTTPSDPARLSARASRAPRTRARSRLPGP